MQKNIIIILLSMLVSVACSAGNDFDKVCGYFEKLQTQVVKGQFSNNERLDFINVHVRKELDSISAARMAWDVVIYASPDIRYELYKTSAEDAVQEKWQCEAMQRLISTTGK